MQVRTEKNQIRTGIVWISDTASLKSAYKSLATQSWVLHNIQMNTIKFCRTAMR
jgi:hypothetical protein